MKKILFAFDLDGTLISWKNSWDEIRRPYGIESTYPLYLSGDLTFSEMKKKELKMWKRAGITKTDVEEIAEGMKYNPGAEEIIEELKEVGVVGIISAAPKEMVEKAANDLEVNFWCSSRILFNGEGKVRGFSLPLATPIDKAEHLMYYCYRHSVPIERSVAVGDSEIDKAMLKVAGFGIAFNPDDCLFQFADRIIEGNSLKSLKRIIDKEVLEKILRPI